MSAWELFDSHAHPDASAFDEDRQEMLQRAREAGLSRLLAVGIWRGPGDFGDALELHRQQPDFVAASVGVHPHDCARVPEEDWRELERLAALPEVVAVGETGLDYHYEHSPRDEQRRWFRFQIEVAERVGKPVIIHSRDADEETLEILRETQPKQALIHCFTSTPEQAERYVEMGLHISVAGVVTFASAHALREAVQRIPLDRLLIETDCPYLAPVPHRGKRNEPAYVARVAEKVAEVKGLPVEEVARATTANAKRLFNLT